MATTFVSSFRATTWIASSTLSLRVCGALMPTAAVGPTLLASCRVNSQCVSGPTTISASRMSSISSSGASRLHASSSSPSHLSAAVSPLSSCASNSLSTTASAAKAKYYLLFYTYVPEMLKRRIPHREAHLNYAAKFKDSEEFVVGGAYSPNNNPQDALTGLLIFKCYSEQFVYEFAKKDPYVINNLVQKYTVHEWTPVLGCIMQPLENMQPKTEQRNN